MNVFFHGTIEAGFDVLKAKIEKDYGNTPWGKRMFDDLFRWL